MRTTITMIPRMIAEVVAELYLFREKKKMDFPLFTLLNHTGNSFEFNFLMKVKILTFQIELF